MAYKIIKSQCILCGDCEFECPNQAIKFKGDTYVIDPNLCNECEGHYDSPRCAEICPMPGTCVPA